MFPETSYLTWVGFAVLRPLHNRLYFVQISLSGFLWIYFLMKPRAGLARRMS